jgi:hypothetical protein
LNVAKRLNDWNIWNGPIPYALLVFTNRNGRLNLKRPTIPVLRSSDPVRFIRNYQWAKDHPVASPELTRAMVHHLHLLQQKPDKLSAALEHFELGRRKRPWCWRVRG